jgi:copper homeostasis protein
MKTQDNVTIEVCLEDAISAIAAQQGGADRIEFCADLFEGGTTPSLGAFLTAKTHANIPMNVMIRPRGGDFCYSDLEFETMLKDVEIFKARGANAIVFGILTPEGEIDARRSAEIIRAARPLPVTFHRAFDMTKNLPRSLETLIDLGVERVLTSGGEPSVMEGILALKDLVLQAGDRITVMPGCGISERNFSYIRSVVHAREYHIFVPGEYDSKMTYRPKNIYMGGVLRQPEFLISHTDASRVRAIAGERE